MKVVATVQARMGSSRLPNKAMALIQDKPMVQHVVERLRHADALDGVALSIPDNADNEVLRHLAIPYFAGAEHDLLDRTIQTARAFEADAIVRITADCPLCDPHTTNEVVQLFRDGGLDYASNVWPDRTYPAGIAIEVYSVGLLDWLNEYICVSRYREYYMVYLWQRGDWFRTANVTYRGPDLSGLRWTVDYEEDLEFMRRVYGELYDPDGIFVMQDILDLLQRRPDIAAINAGIAIKPLHGLEVK